MAECAFDRDLLLRLRALALEEPKPPDLGLCQAQVDGSAFEADTKEIKVKVRKLLMLVERQSRKRNEKADLHRKVGVEEPLEVSFHGAAVVRLTVKVEVDPRPVVSRRVVSQAQGRQQMSLLGGALPHRQN